MKKIKEIIEYRSKSQREDFLEYLLERGIDSEEKDDIISIILSYFPSHNDWTSVLLIDLTNDEKIISESLLSIYLMSLSKSKSYYIKLSILDYISATKDLYENSNIDINFDLIERLVCDKKNRLIVRNQALLLLIKIYPTRTDELLLQLKRNFAETSDYRAHIRLYTTLLNNKFYKKVPKEDILNFIKISNIMDLGKAVKSIIEELELKLS